MIIHTLKNTQHTFLQIYKNITSIVNSKWTFTDTNPESKKYHRPIKMVTIIKTKKSVKIYH